MRHFCSRRAVLHKRLICGYTRSAAGKVPPENRTLLQLFRLILFGRKRRTERDEPAGFEICCGRGRRERGRLRQEQKPHRHAGLKPRLSWNVRWRSDEKHPRKPCAAGRAHRAAHRRGRRRVRRKNPAGQRGGGHRRFSRAAQAGRRLLLLYRNARRARGYDARHVGYAHHFGFNGRLPERKPRAAAKRRRDRLRRLPALRVS